MRAKGNRPDPFGRAPKRRGYGMTACPDKKSRYRNFLRSSRTLIPVILGPLLSVAAHAAPADVEGSYFGCRHSVILGDGQVAFHLMKLPTGLGPDEFQYASALTWIKHSPEFFFSDVKIDTQGTALFMTLNIPPNHDYGKIVTTATVQVQPDGSLRGNLKSNGMNQEGILVNGTFSAKKFPAENVLPNVNCDDGLDARIGDNQRDDRGHDDDRERQSPARTRSR